MKVLAIDPGTRFSGYAVMTKKNRSIQLIDHGFLRIPTINGWVVRIGIFYDFFENKIQIHNATDICFETPFLYKNASTFLKLGYIRGLIYLLAYKHNLRVNELSPSEIKQLICAKGNASKEEISTMIYKYFPNLEKNMRDDVTDAIAIGLCQLKYPQKKICGQRIK